MASSWRQTNLEIDSESDLDDDEYDDCIIRRIQREIDGTGESEDADVKLSEDRQDDTASAVQDAFAGKKLINRSCVSLLSPDEALKSTQLTFYRKNDESGTIQKKETRNKSKRFFPCVPASSSLHSEGQNTPATQSDADSVSKTFGIPAPGWHVPLTFLDLEPKRNLDTGKGQVHPRNKSTDDTESKRKTGRVKKDSAADLEGNCREGVKRNSETVKNKEKAKRLKGQSTHDSWKPEIWMKMRQTFD